MKEEEERLFKGLDVLRSAAWNSFDQRRSYEWKFGIALWTAQAIFTGTLLTQSSDKVFPLTGRWPVLLTASIGCIAVVIHAYWSKGISEANDSDRRKSDVYEKHMCPMVGVSHKEEILPIVKGRLEKMGTLTNYSHSSQVAITFLLSVAALLAMWLRTR
jgi:hypothetical protein